MSQSSEDFSLAIEGFTGSRPAAQKWAEKRIARKAIQVLSSEGPRTSGDVARQEFYARAFYAETAQRATEQILVMPNGDDTRVAESPCRCSA